MQRKGEINKAPKRNIWFVEGGRTKTTLRAIHQLLLDNPGINTVNFEIESEINNTTLWRHLNKLGTNFNQLQGFKTVKEAEDHYKEKYDTHLTIKRYGTNKRQKKNFTPPIESWVEENNEEKIFTKPINNSLKENNIELSKNDSRKVSTSLQDIHLLLLKCMKQNSRITLIEFEEISNINHSTLRRHLNLWETTFDELRGLKTEKAALERYGVRYRNDIHQISRRKRKLTEMESTPSTNKTRRINPTQTNKNDNYLPSQDDFIEESHFNPGRNEHHHLNCPYNSTNSNMGYNPYRNRTDMFDNQRSVPWDQRYIPRNPYYTHQDPYYIHQDPYYIHQDPYYIHQDPYYIHQDPYYIHQDPYYIHQAPYGAPPTIQQNQYIQNQYFVPPIFSNDPDTDPIPNYQSQRNLELNTTNVLPNSRLDDTTFGLGDQRQRTGPLPYFGKEGLFYHDDNSNEHLQKKPEENHQNEDNKYYSQAPIK